MDNNIGYIYFIRQTSIQTKEMFYKIGFSKDIEKRLRELKTGNPNILEIKYKISNSTIEFEKHIHLICQNYRLDGEWFKEEVVNFLLIYSSPWFRQNIEKYTKPIEN